jgi:hypothetical protein
MNELRANGSQPPILYYCEYADMWSMGDMFESIIKVTGEGASVILSVGDMQVICCPVLYGEDKPETISLRLRTLVSLPHMPKETRWLVNKIDEATEAWEQLNSRAVIIISRRVVGTTVLDSEVWESLHVLPEWVRREEEG